jgi:hypothetical protein
LTARVVPALVLVIASAASGTASADCLSIQSGALINDQGEPISTGFDAWGFNYGAHLFNGTYCDANQDAAWCQEYREDELQMKWNDAWLSSRDCDGDAKLDRHLGYASYIGSGAWLTNHQSGWVQDASGKRRKWTYFIKIVAAQSDDELIDGMWYRAGVEVGPKIWDEFIIVQEIYNDPTAGAHGILYKSPVGPGLGNLAD